jgi:hypothetical protein
MQFEIAPGTVRRNIEAAGFEVNDVVKLIIYGVDGLDPENAGMIWIQRWVST